MVTRHVPSPIPVQSDRDRFEIVADHLAHSAAATAIMASGLRRQIERDQLSKQEILEAIDAIAEEAISAHSLAASVFVESAASS